MFNARLVVYILHRKLLGDNVYKQWELGMVMVVWLEIEAWVIGKGGIKHVGEWKAGDGADGGRWMGTGFCGRCLCRDCSKKGVCMFGTVG
jgi:hypothetical protein